jgi:cytochrome P450 family 6
MEMMDVLLLLSSTVAGLFGVLYLYLSYVYTYWKKRGVPFLEPSFPTGNILDMVLSRRTVGEIYIEFYKRLSGHKFVGLYQLHRPTLLLTDPELIKDFLVRDFEHFQDHGFPFDENVDPLAANLFMLNGDKWKKLRSKLSPTFTSVKMKMMFQTLVDCGQELGNFFEQPASRGDIVEVKEVLARFTTDIIASCAFGIQCNCLKDPDAEFRRWGRKLFEPSVKQNLRDIMYFLVPSIAIALKISNIPADVTSFFMKIVKETVEYRERSKVTRNDFMQLLIQLKNQGYVDTDDEDNEKLESEYVFYFLLFSSS